MKIGECATLEQFMSALFFVEVVVVAFPTVELFRVRSDFEAAVRAPRSVLRVQRNFFG
jgi:hypothetical protein